MSKGRKLIRKLAKEYTSRYAKARFLRKVFRNRKRFPGLAARFVAEQQAYEKTLIEKKFEQRKAWNNVD